MKVHVTLTNEEIYEIDNAVIETTTELKEIDMINKEKKELLKDGDVIDTGAIRIERSGREVEINIESKFVFWCLKFATKISKLVKAVYDMFSGLFEDLIDNDYFRDDVIYYNAKEPNPTKEGKEKICEALTKLREAIKAANVSLSIPDVREELLREIEGLKVIIKGSPNTYWPEAINLLSNIEDKLDKRTDDELWEELWSNIGNFLIDNKD